MLEYVRGVQFAACFNIAGSRYTYSSRKDVKSMLDYIRGVHFAPCFSDHSRFHMQETVGRDLTMMLDHAEVLQFGP